MNWNALCIAGLLLISPIALAQDNSAAGDSGDETSSNSGDGSLDEYGLAGMFAQEFNDSNEQEFKAIVAEFGGRITPGDANDPYMFGVDQLATKEDCENLANVLETRSYIERLESCRRTVDDDGEPTNSGSGSSDPDGTSPEQPPEDDPKEEDTQPEPVPHEEEPKDEPSDDHASDAPEDDMDDRRHAAAECEQEQDREDKEECFEDYCEDPHPNHAEPCQKFLQNREQQEERQESQEEFRTCKEGASTAAQRRECAEEYADDVQDDDRWERESKIYEAKQNGKVGARAIVRADAATTATDVEEYDVMVNVVTQGAKARDENVDFRVTVSAELLEGRTIVLDVDPEVLSGPTLVVRYFDVFDDGSETEVIIRQASDLSDVLDPTDDGGQPEYWVVKDANGLQLMASVPHWSVHAITVQGIGEFVSAPSVIAGVIFGVVGSVMAAAVLFKPRKGDDL